MSKFLQGYTPLSNKEASKPQNQPYRGQTKEREPGKRRGRYRQAEDRPDTTEALRALLLRIGNGEVKLRSSARMLGTGHSALSGYINKKRSPPTLDTMASFIECAKEEAGVSMTISFGPDRRVEWTFM
tara:strand:- start:437 stop:820 length:384 start_codon:yes stop_codon:yes gene_type:complete